MKCNYQLRSVDYLRQATPAQIAEVPGIGAKLAQIIYDYFHPSDR
nr:helix-hairpin-helix domain-containing protein [Nostoc sp. PCC 7524]